MMDGGFRLKYRLTQQILVIHLFTLQVLFVDLGVVDVVPVGKLLKLPTEFLDVPFQVSEQQTTTLLQVLN